MALESHDALKEIIKNKSFRTGDFVLSSGVKSKFYFDLKPSMLDPQGSVLIAAELYRIIQNYAPDYVGGLELGAVPITASLVSYSNAQANKFLGFIVRKKAKLYGTANLIEGLPQGTSLVGKKVVVIDDVTTTGNSIVKSVEQLKDLGANVVLAVSVIDRREQDHLDSVILDVPFTSVFTLNDFKEPESKPNTVFNMWDSYLNFWKIRS